MSLVPFNPNPGLVTDDTTRLAANTWKDADGIRFYRGQAQTQAGYESFVDELLTGVCRDIFPWTDNGDAPNVAFGTNSNLQVQTGGLLVDITPTLNLPARELGTDPMTATNGSPTVTVTDPNHLMATGESVTLSGVTTFEGLTPNGTFTVTVIDADTWTFNAGTNATGAGVGGGSAIIETPGQPWKTGNVDGIGGQGFGTGAFGTGEFSEPSGIQFYPRTSSFDAWGENLLYNPRGGAIYQWQNDPTQPALPIANAPAQVTYMMLAKGKRQVLALGCSREADGLFIPLCIRGCDFENLNNWTPDPTNNSFETVLDGSGYIVGARSTGNYLLVWTDSGLWVGTFVNSADELWDFELVADKCGLIGPNAVTMVGTVAYWMAPNGQLWTYAVGGQPSLIVAPVMAEVVKNISTSQQGKIVMSTIASFSSVRFYYPDARDGNENSRWVEFDMPNGATAPNWWRGQLVPRTAFCDVSAAYNYPIGVSPGGAAYLHEKGMSADGGALTCFLESTDQFIDDTQGLVFVTGMRPDFKDQQGTIMLTIFGRDDIQAPERTYGPFALAPNQSRATFRAYGRIVRLRFDAASSALFFRFGLCEFDGSPLPAQR